MSTGAERLNLDEKTIADTFHAAGYVCGAFGKWHNGSQYPYHPLARGFDEYYGFTSGHWGQYFDPILEHNGKLVRGQGYIADDLTEHALAFIEQNRTRPFFCYVPYNIPHSPFQVPDRFYEKFRDAARSSCVATRDIRKRSPRRGACWRCARTSTGTWAASCKKLDELKLAENTIVVYFSDNGPADWRWNGGMKGKKGSTDEGGVREPCFMRWPGHIAPSRTIPQIAAAIDLLPTLASLAGIPVIGGKPLDGVDLTPLLQGKTARDGPTA